MSNKKDDRAQFEEIFQNIKPKEAKEIDEQTIKLIEHVHNRVSYTDQKHRTSFEACIAVLTFAVAIGVFLNEYNKEWLLIASPLVISLTIVGLAGITLFVFQDRFKRPFIEVAHTWRWFYHYCINPNVPVGPFLREAQKEESKKEYLRGLSQYAKNSINATPQQILKQDIEQLFILLTGERLKNEFLKQSQGVLGYGVLLSFVSFGINMFVLHAVIAIEWTIDWALPISLCIFVLSYVIVLTKKVVPTTKSKKDWHPITEP